MGATSPATQKEPLTAHPSNPKLIFLLPSQAFEGMLQLAEARAIYQDFCIPMCVLPATISNNVPGNDLSLGADTALNAIMEVRY